MDEVGLDSCTVARVAQIQAKRRNAGRSAGWQEGWDLRSAVDVVLWYLNSGVDL